MKLIKKLGTRVTRTGHISSYGLFQCLRCGAEAEKLLHAGRKAKNCGCLMREKHHSMHGSPLYKVWCYMKKRCLNKNATGFKNYGGRGITICSSWLEFKPFSEWAKANGYKKGLELDRRNNDGNYTPENCRFVTHAVNSRNSRRSKLTMGKANEIRVIYEKGLLCHREIGEMYGVSGRTVCSVINNKAWI